MLKTHERLVAYLQQLLDFSLAYSIWMTAYFIRFHFIWDAQVGLTKDFFRAGFVVSIVTIFVFRRMGLYRSFRLRPAYLELQDLAKANVVANLIFVTFLYLLAEERLSRSVVIVYFISSTFAFLALRLVGRRVLNQVRKSGRNLRHFLLIGAGAAMEQYVTTVLSSKESGVRFKGWIDSRGLADKYQIRSATMDMVGGASNLEFDGVVIGYQGEDLAKLGLVLKKVYNDVVPIIILPDTSYSVVGYEIEHIAGIPSLVVNQPKLTTIDLLTKRTFDLVVSFFGLIFLSPLFLCLGLIIKLTSPGPIFFAQERVGLDGKKFKMWKFRSMKVSSDASGSSETPGWTIQDDPRRTKIGVFLRSASLDELPQLWNVFKGDMSLVGPRPEQPYFVEKFRHEIPAYMLRHKVKAGITGWAQVNGWRGDTSLPKRIEFDLFYIKNWSLWMDIKILILTLRRGVFNKNAY